MGLKCSHCTVINMPEANFCHGCGKPLAPPVEMSNSRQADKPQAGQRLCFRCSAPLVADAKVCEKCGLNVENLFHAQSQSQHAAKLAELTFFSQPPPPDPQAAAVKTYAGWFAVIVLSFITSYAAYSWLEASNVIGRLTGDSASEPKMHAEQQRDMMPRMSSQSPTLDLLPQDSVENVSAAGEAYPQAATVTGEPVESMVAIEESSTVPSDSRAAESTSAVSQPPPASLEGAMEGPAEVSEQVVTPESALTEETAPDRIEAAQVAPSAPRPEVKPRQKRVAVTQIEPSGQPRNEARTEVEEFFRRWKKSIKQGVTERPCTQQEVALNQCN